MPNDEKIAIRRATGSGLSAGWAFSRRLATENDASS